jgi:hypothetical protein
MIKLTRIESRIALSLQDKQNKLKTIAPQAYDFFYKQTPIRTGNARSKTKLNNDKIVANYPYVGRLDRGWSQQAPQGMVKPTLIFIRRLVRNLLGR